MWGQEGGEVIQVRGLACAKEEGDCNSAREDDGHRKCSLLVGRHLGERRHGWECIGGMGGAGRELGVFERDLRVERWTVSGLGIGICDWIWGGEG